MDIESIKAFYISATLRNISHAAERLNMTRSAISKRIVVLEDELGVRLLDRSGTGVELTEEGMAFLEYAADACERAEAIRNSLRSMQKSDAGTLKIITTISLGGKWLSNYVTEFLEDHPQQTLELIYEERKSLNLTSANTGVYVGLVNLKPKDISFFIVNKVAKYHLYPYAHPNYLKELNETTHISNLDKHKIILYKFHENFSWIKDEEINILKYHGLQPGKVREPTLLTDDALSGFYFALQGAGIIMLPKYIAAKSDLVPLTIKGFIPEGNGTHHIYFLYPYYLKNNTRIKSFLSFIKLKIKESGHFLTS
ncbi:MAG: LysR family transcriptional regulator [Alphaproteobacteria bacterium]|nr:LysR family transcriptional regulator [Alphaproteobacteria bacterium]OJV46316.1 MAG: hypothetical protein BGO28_03035 [Alphaproteobacteria bacterium 43-37]